MATKGDISDLKTLTFGGKPMVPSVAVGGYSRTKGSGVINSNTTGGATRQRKKYYGNVHVVEATFYMDTSAQHDYMEIFINQNEGKKWICHLTADRPIVEPYVVQTVSEWQFSDINSSEATLTVTLEVFSVRDPALDAFLMVMYESQVGDDISEWVVAMNSLSGVIPLEQ